MSKHGMIRGSLSSIVKYLSSAFDELRKNIPTFSSNVRQSAPKNSGSKTSGHRTSHESNSNTPRKPHGRVKSLGHYEEAHKRAEKQGLGVLHEELNVLQGILNRFEKKTKKKPRKGQRPQRQQSSPPRRKWWFKLRMGNKSKETNPQSGKRPQRRQSSPPRGKSGFFKFW